MGREYKKGKESYLFKDLTNKRFGKLIAIDFVEHKNRNNKISYKWKCLCDCGETCYVRSNILSKNIQEKCFKCAIKETSTNRIILDNGSLINRIYRNYKRGARNRNLDFELSKDEFIKLINDKCYYCNSEPKINKGEIKYFKTGELKRNGIDRINSNIGYIKNNVVSCCDICNRIKGDMGVDDFKELIIKIYDFFIKSYV